MDDQGRIPVIKLYGNLIVSIQVALSDRLVLRLKDDITHRIRNSDARGLVIDLSGIDVLDSYISNAVREIGMIAKLMGVSTVICGLDPMIAMTLVEMGLDMQGVRAAGDLESALEMLASLERHRQRRTQAVITTSGSPGRR